MATIKPRDANGKISLNSFTKNLFLQEMDQSRLSQGESILDFAFNKSRCRVLSKYDKISEGTRGVLYWMSRDCRVQDNWSLLFAQRLALKRNLPLFVCFTLFEAHYRYPTRRHQQFLLEGLKLVAIECEALSIPFYILKESPKDLANIVVKNQLGGVICDFSPLRKPQEWINGLVNSLPESISVVQVDAHNIVPAWIASEKQEVMAKTLRPKITKKLAEYLTGFPVVAKHPYTGTIQVNNIDPKEALSSLKSLWNVEPVSNIEAGSAAGLEQLHTFLHNGLKHYGITSNDPSKDHTSNLSFWINYGHISAQRVALEVKSFEPLYKEPVDKYLEELIVRKELAENYCFYNNNYDNIQGAADWARKSLLVHTMDKRAYIYTREEFEKAKTHDEMWNAAQHQLVNEGKIHGYMRMYWCKKVLEWTKSPEEALEFAIWLNDTFALDGNDPNGFVGIMWSICGVHDQGWKERDIFGKIRFMVDYSLRRKFNMDTYCARYGKNMKGVKRKISK